MRPAFCLGAAILLGSAASAMAQTASDEVVRALLQRIEVLERRVNALEAEARGPAAPPATAAPAVPGGSPTPLRQDLHDEGMAAVAQAEYPSLKLTGFSDVNFSATDQPGIRSGFTEGQFALHLTSALSPRVAFFGELTLTARTDAGAGSPPATGFNAEVERSIIRFDRNDYFKLSFGRYHTPINWWNTAFHHGAWLQTTISRPEMTQFGGRFIPVHFVGGLVEGAAPAGGFNLNYKAGLGNGRASLISRAGDAGDTNNNRAWLFNVSAKPDRPFGLQVGGAAYFDQITLSDARDFDERILSAHVIWQHEDPEAIFEYADVAHHEFGVPGTLHSPAFYAQVAYRLPWFQHLWKPYYRYEDIDVPGADRVFRDVASMNGSTLGVRFDISTFAAIKAEYRNIRRAPSPSRTNGGFFQTSFTF
jgi:hypothetical protein